MSNCSLVLLSTFPLAYLEEVSLLFKKVYGLLLGCMLNVSV